MKGRKEAREMKNSRESERKNSEGMRRAWDKENERVNVGQRDASG